MGEIVDIGNTNKGELTQEQLQDIKEKAMDIALEQNGMSDVFKGQDEWEQEQRTFSQAGLTVPNIQSPLDEMDEATEKKRSKKPREKKAPVPAAKPQSTNALIEKLKEQIVVIGYIDSIAVGDIPTPLSKDNRDRLIAMGKEIENIKAKYINQVQK